MAKTAVFRLSYSLARGLLSFVHGSRTRFFAQSLWLSGILGRRPWGSWLGGPSLGKKVETSPTHQLAIRQPSYSRACRGGNRRGSEGIVVGRVLRGRFWPWKMEKFGGKRERQQGERNVRRTNRDFRSRRTEKPRPCLRGPFTSSGSSALSSLCFRLSSTSFCKPDNRIESGPHLPGTDSFEKHAGSSSSLHSPGRMRRHRTPDSFWKLNGAMSSNRGRCFRGPPRRSFGTLAFATMGESLFRKGEKPWRTAAPAFCNMSATLRSYSKIAMARDFPQGCPNGRGGAVVGYKCSPPDGMENTAADQTRTGACRRLAQGNHFLMLGR